MKRQGSAELPRCAVGALAIAGASAANAATVQITFTGSFISTTGGNNLVADFGDDGTAEISGTVRAVTGGHLVKVNLLDSTGTLWAAYGAPVEGNTVVGAGNTASNVGGVGAGVATLRGLVAVSFTDANIRGGASTTGYLDMTATASQPGEKIITVNRLIFDEDSGGAIAGLNVNDAAFTEYTLSAVPEPGSNLALLALGAGGLTLRRRLKRAA